MRPVVKYAGREEIAPADWKVYFDLVDEDGATRYWCQFQTTLTEIDVEAPYFWGYMAYLGGKRIEDRVIVDASTHEFHSPEDEAAWRARTNATGSIVEPSIGQVCWRFGSPPYDEDTSGDAFGH